MVVGGAEADGKEVDGDGLDGWLDDGVAGEELPPLGLGFEPEPEPAPEPEPDPEPPEGWACPLPELGGELCGGVLPVLPLPLPPLGCEPLPAFDPDDGVDAGAEGDDVLGLGAVLPPPLPLPDEGVVTTPEGPPKLAFVQVAPEHFL